MGWRVGDQIGQPIVDGRVLSPDFLVEPFRQFLDELTVLQPLRARVTALVAGRDINAGRGRIPIHVVIGSAVLDTVQTSYAIRVVVAA